MALAQNMAPDDEIRRLEQFTGDDAKAAQDAFIYLSSRIERFLWRYLSTHVPLSQDREDVIAIVLEKLYLRRKDFQFQNLGAWYAFVAKTAKNCAMDRRDGRVAVELTEELPDRDIDVIGSVANISHFKSLLYKIADELWLGIPKDLTSAERNRRLLAAQLHFFHSRSWKEICAMVGQEQPIARETLDRWLSDPAVLRDLAYRSMYCDNETLTRILLGGDKPLARRDLDLLATKAHEDGTELPEGWTWQEIKVAIWRYRNGLNTEKILQMEPRLTRVDVEKTYAKCIKRLPFEDISRVVTTALKRHKAPLNPLACPEVWKRLVFQYSLIQELPHKQILERTEPAARVAGYSLTAAMLNGWLSNGRLTEQLATYASKEHYQ